MNCLRQENQKGLEIYPNKSQVTETSKKAFEKIKHIRSNTQHLVFEALRKLGYASNTMIAKELGWTINRVTPRINELRKKGFVFFSHKTNCPITRNKCIFWTTILKDDE